MRTVRVALAAALAAVLAAACSTPPLADGPYQATGIKVGEVTPTSAIVWTRLTAAAERVDHEMIRPPVRYRRADADGLVDPPVWPATPANWSPVVELPEGMDVQDMQGAAPGAAGETRVLYRVSDGDEWAATDWQAVDPDRDYTRQHTLEGLQPATEYALRIESRPRGKDVSSTVEGRLATAPAENTPARVVFGSVTGQDYINKDRDDGYNIYPAMLARRDLDFFVHTGDILYYDSWAKNLELARWGWAQMFSLPTNIEFQRLVPTYFMKDDHDVWLNDAYPTQQSLYMGDFTFAQGQAVFLEQVPMASERTYRTFRWGQDLQIWLIEARDYRDANEAPDGPDKTMWGEEQIAWLEETVAVSDATFKVLIVPTPLTGPYIDPFEMDNHTNEAGFATEGRRLREFVAAQDNMYVITGDRHYQYVIEDPVTGIFEYATGPASNSHARGWDSDDIRPEHRYLNVVGGFLLTTVVRRDDIPRMLMQHYSVNGTLLHEHVRVADGF